MIIQPQTDGEVSVSQSGKLILISIVRAASLYVIQYVWQGFYFVIGNGSTLVRQTADAYLLLLTIFSFVISIGISSGSKQRSARWISAYIVFVSPLLSCGLYHVLYLLLLQLSYSFSHHNVSPEQLLIGIKHASIIAIPIFLTCLEFYLLKVSKANIFFLLLICTLTVFPYVDESFVSNCKPLNAGHGVFDQWIERDCSK
jgi:hypothetical protein